MGGAAGRAVASAGVAQAAVFLTLEDDSGSGLFLVAFATAYFAALAALVVQLALPTRASARSTSWRRWARRVRRDGR